MTGGLSFQTFSFFNFIFLLVLKPIFLEFPIFMLLFSAGCTVWKMRQKMPPSLFDPFIGSRSRTHHARQLRWLPRAVLHGCSQKYATYCIRADYVLKNLSDCACVFTEYRKMGKKMCAATQDSQEAEKERRERIEAASSGWRTLQRPVLVTSAFPFCFLSLLTSWVFWIWKNCLSWQKRGKILSIEQYLR